MQTDAEMDDSKDIQGAGNSLGSTSRAFPGQYMGHSSANTVPVTQRINDHWVNHGSYQHMYNQTVHHTGGYSIVSTAPGSQQDTINVQPLYGQSGMRGNGMGPGFGSNQSAGTGMTGLQTTSAATAQMPKTYPQMPQYDMMTGMDQFHGSNGRLAYPNMDFEFPMASTQHPRDGEGCKTFDYTQMDFTLPTPPLFIINVDNLSYFPEAVTPSILLHEFNRLPDTAAKFLDPIFFPFVKASTLYQPRDETGILRVSNVSQTQITLTYLRRCINVYPSCCKKR